jgi:hypothetical protein
VWTLRQLITFLNGVEDDRLVALWWLIALRGLRRGEAAGLHRDDLDSASRELAVSRQLVALPGSCTAARRRAGPAAAPSPSTTRALGGSSARPSSRASS